MTEKVKVKRKKNPLVIVLSHPQLPEKWDFDESIKKCKKLIYRWANMTDELANELWIAREMLSSQGNPNLQYKNSTGKNFPVKTWASYCEEIGVTKRSINSWLKKWFEKIGSGSQIDSDSPTEGEFYKLFVGDINNPPYDKLPSEVDWIITDPPYPEKYLSLWKSLAVFASKILKPGGSLFAMSGQSYLPEVIKNLNSVEEIKYYWCSCYLTPGPSTQLRQKQINTKWKPILWYVKNDYTAKTVKDVFTSPKLDKKFHEWGQSCEGIIDIIESITLPNQVIVDPFLGGGSTAEAAVRLKRFFYGFDIDEEAVLTSRTRMKKVMEEINKNNNA